MSYAADRMVSAQGPLIAVLICTAAGENMRQSDQYTVVYDGVCKVCTRVAKVLKRWDQSLEVVSFQTAGVQERFPWIPASAFSESLQLVDRSGRTWQGAAAIEQLLHVLPRGRPVSWLFHIPFVRGLADHFYRWFARNRYHLGCGEHCQTRPLHTPRQHHRDSLGQ